MTHQEGDELECHHSGPDRTMCMGMTREAGLHRAEKKQTGNKDERGERDIRTRSSGLPVLTVFRVQGIHFYSNHKSHFLALS